MEPAFPSSRQFADLVETFQVGLERAALIAESMSYFSVARAIRANGDPVLLQRLLRERDRQLIARTNGTARVLREVDAERTRQEELFPDEVLTDGTGAANGAELAAIVQRWGDSADQAGHDTFARILVEETLEALAETDIAKLRKEVVQIAAVCVKWVEALDRQTGVTPSDVAPKPTGEAAQ